jgi:hypothetical protein
MRGLLLVLLAIDFTLIVLYGVHSVHLDGALAEAIARDDGFKIHKDRGYAELFEYAKLFVSSLGLGWLAWRERQLIYSIGSLLLSFLLFDNALRWHEDVGMWGGDAFHLVGAMRGLSGEVVQAVYWGIIGGLFVLAGLMAGRRADGKARYRARQIAWGVGGLALFGIAFDMIHSVVSMVQQSRVINGLFAIIEDGGELIVLSWICAVVLSAVYQEQLRDR